MSSTGSQRRRSGLWDSEATAVAEKEAKRHRLPGRSKQSKEPSPYDEWLMQEKQKSQPQLPPAASGPRPGPLARNQSSTTSAATIRTVTPEMDHHASLPSLNNTASTVTTTTYDEAVPVRPYTPHNAAAAASSPKTASSPRGASKTRRLVKEREWERDGHNAQPSPPSSRNGTSSSGRHGLVGSSLLSRRKSSGQRSQHGGVDSSQYEHEPIPQQPPSATRPRTKTMEERRREPSPGTGLTKTRKRLGSVHTSSPSMHSRDTEFNPTMAPIPSQAHSSAAPASSSRDSPRQSPTDNSGRRSASPTSALMHDSIATLPVDIQRRIGHLAKTMAGNMSGSVEYRRTTQAPWTPASHCTISPQGYGRLTYENGTERPEQTLISHLRGAAVTYNIEAEVLYLQINSAVSAEEAHIKVATQQEFDAWYAALLHWQALDPSLPPTAPTPARQESRPSSRRDAGPPAAHPEGLHHHRRSSATNNRSRAGSNRSDRRRSLAATIPKENPVIKIGKMIYWETSPAGYANSSTTSLNQLHSSSRSVNYLMQAAGGRRWRRISGQLRENGELKLHADADNSLISVVQLSQLSRCAIQRLDTSVLECDHCIAIYPQYTSSYTNTQPGVIRPIFLGLENRVLHEVWFVLLRAFTMPAIYGPRIEAQQGVEAEGADVNQDLENMIATSTSYAFRMERSLHIKIVEAKLVSPTIGLDGIHNGGSSKSNSSPDKHGYYAEVLLDNETRGKTVVKYDPIHPIWVEQFEFQDLPAVLGSASVIIRRRPPEQVLAREKEMRQLPETHGDQQGVVTSLGFDSTCGKVEIHLDELDGDRFAERWLPATNMHGQKVAEVLINARAQEGIVLMARDYRPLGDVLHRFANGVTMRMAEMVPSEVKRLSDCLLDIFQVSGKATDWIKSLIEEEIDGVNRDAAPSSRLRYGKRTGSEAQPSSDAQAALSGSPAGPSEREQLVRDMNKTAALEANLLFRGNTLLTRVLDTHMRRVGKEWLEASLTDTLQQIVDKDLDTEVDPARAPSHDIDRNWRRLLLFTQDVWKGIMAASERVPVELRLVFRHIRACAEDRYGDFLRTVQYSSVSGFLFLRFFCPAVLNPNLFGLLKGDLRLRNRRTFTLIAKSLQTMANMATFGTKEPWMEPMNAFIIQHRDTFKKFVDDVCYVPEPISNVAHPSSPTSSPTYPPEVISVERHMSYATPTTIMQRLPPSSREGFPSLPYLIDQARSYADLIQIWLEAIETLSRPSDTFGGTTRTHTDILNQIAKSDEQFKLFHHLCERLNSRTQECLARAERAERPESAPSFQWEDIIDQLRNSQITNNRDLFDMLTDRIANDPSVIPEEANPAVAATIAQLRGHFDEQQMTDDEQQTRLYDLTPPESGTPSAFETPRYHDRSNHGTRPGSAHTNASTSYHSNANFSNLHIVPRGEIGMSPYQQQQQPPLSSSQQSQQQAYPPQRPYPLKKSSTSPGHSAAASVSNLSSTVSSDTEHPTTALPSYEREIRHRERREAARLEIQHQVAEAARQREREKEKKQKMAKLVPGFKKKRQERSEGSARGAAAGIHQQTAATGPVPSSSLDGGYGSQG